VSVDDLFRVDQLALQCVRGGMGFTEATFGVVPLRRAGRGSKYVTEERRVAPGTQHA